MSNQHDPLAGLYALAEWHETKAEKAALGPFIDGENMNRKAGEKHTEAAKKLRAALAEASEQVASLVDQRDAYLREAQKRDDQVGKAVTRAERAEAERGLERDEARENEFDELRRENDRFWDVVAERDDLQAAVAELADKECSSPLICDPDPESDCVGGRIRALLYDPYRGDV